jgi:putative zinc finger/helix-turn-helix YgiT family protein
MNLANLTTCDCCGSTDIEELLTDTSFEYGEEEKVVLHTKVPVISCKECGMEYTDERAEKIRHEAVCKHLNLLAPSEIRQIRLIYSESMVSFCNHTGIGSATLTRWENGQVIQNRSSDSLLRLLRDEANYQRLKTARMKTAEPESIFPNLSFNEPLKARANGFSLR